MFLRAGAISFCDLVAASAVEVLEGVWNVRRKGWQEIELSEEGVVKRKRCHEKEMLQCRKRNVKRKTSEEKDISRERAVKRKSCQEKFVKRKLSLEHKCSDKYSIFCRHILSFALEVVTSWSATSWVSGRPYLNDRAATRTSAFQEKKLPLVNTAMKCHSCPASGMTISAVACVSDIEDLANRASVSCSSSGRMSCQRNSASFTVFRRKQPALNLQILNLNLKISKRPDVAGELSSTCLRDLSHSRRRSRPASLLRGQISSWIASTLRRLDGGCQSKKITRSLVLKCQTVKLSAPLQIALNVTRCQLWQENINLPKFNCCVPRNCQVSKQRNPQKWVANHYPCRPRCYPRLAHVHVNHLSGRAASRNHLRRHHGQCQGLSWAVVSWFCRVYWLIGILIVHYGWCIKIISMKSGRAISINRTRSIGHPYSWPIKCLSQEPFEIPLRRLPRQTRLLHLRGNSFINNER